MISQNKTTRPLTQIRRLSMVLVAALALPLMPVAGQEHDRHEHRTNSPVIDALERAIELLHQKGERHHAESLIRLHQVLSGDGHNEDHEHDEKHEHGEKREHGENEERSRNRRGRGEERSGNRRGRNEERSRNRRGRDEERSGNRRQHEEDEEHNRDENQGRNRSNRQEARHISISVNGNDPRKAMEDVERRLMEAVKNGKMSRENAERTLKEVREQIRRSLGDNNDRKRNQRERDEDGDRQEEMAGRANRIKQAVKDGKISRENAAKRLRSLKVKGRSDEGRSKNDDRKSKTKKINDPRKAMEDVERRLMEAVKNGKISREDAAKRLRSLKAKGRSDEGRSKNDDRKSKTKKIN